MYIYISLPENRKSMKLEMHLLIGNSHTTTSQDWDFDRMLIGQKHKVGNPRYNKPTIWGWFIGSIYIHLLHFSRDD